MILTSVSVYFLDYTTGNPVFQDCDRFLPFFSPVFAILFVVFCFQHVPRRGTWTINPVTRKPANPKAYNRKKARKWKDDSHSVPFVSVFAPL